MRRLLLRIVVISGVFFLTPPSNAAAIVVVAIGGGNTAGAGVGKDKAFPALLQELLRGRGYDVRVVNAGHPGDSTREILARINLSVPPRTDIVIFEQGGAEDPNAQAEKDGSAMVGLRLGVRGIALISVLQPLAGISKSNLQPDARHLNEDGHRILARRLAPRVIAEIKKIGDQSRNVP